MPRLSPAGSALMGIAGQALSIDGATPATFSGIQSGGWGWLSNTVIFGQDNIGGVARVHTYDVGSTALSLIANTGANWTVAGGGTYAYWVGSGAGVGTNVGVSVPAASFPLACSPLGDLAVLDVFQSASSGVRVYAQGGALLTVNNASLIYNGLATSCPAFLRDDILTYGTAAGFQLCQYRPTPQFLSFLVRNDGVNWLTPVVDGTDIWVLERNNIGALTIREKTATTAWVVVAGPSSVTFNPDVVLLSPGNVRIAWAETIGEERATLVVMDLDLATGANDVGVVVGTSLSFSPGAALSTTTVAGTLVPGSPASGGGGGPAGPGATGTPGASVLAKRVAPPPPPAPTRVYPHVDEISHWPTQQSLRLAWDRVGDMQPKLEDVTRRTDGQDARIAELEAQITTLQQLVRSMNGTGET